MGIAVEAKPDAEKTIFNHIHTQTFTLPRQLGENEKAFMLCMSHLFGYFRSEPDNPEMVQSLYFNVFMRAFSTLQVTHIAHNPFSNWHFVLDDAPTHAHVTLIIFLNLRYFATAFLPLLFLSLSPSMQRYLCSPETAASIIATSSNLFVPAAPSLIPVEKTSMLVNRLFGSPKQTKLYQPVEQRRYSRAVSLSVTEKLEIFGGKQISQMNRTCLVDMPTHLVSVVWLVGKTGVSQLISHSSYF